MTSKHYGWQKRWRIDIQAGTGSHESGLHVQFILHPGRRADARITDPNNVKPALLAKHGGHNLPAMLARLTREALQLRAAAFEPKRETAARFILRRLPPDKQKLGGQFELVRAAEDDHPLSAVSFSSIRGGYEVEMLEPVPELELLRTIGAPGVPSRLFYKLPHADVSVHAQQAAFEKATA